jgi:hypothetical protein
VTQAAPEALAIAGIVVTARRIYHLTSENKQEDTPVCDRTPILPVQWDGATLEPDPRHDDGRL